MIEKREVYIPCFHTMRTLHIYLPIDYAKSNKHYPVVYMYDGHNLFYDEDATFGTCWGLRSYLDKKGAELIIVGIECNHEGNQRLEEFSPYDFHDTYVGYIHGRGIALMDWVVQDCKPWIDRIYRTKKDRKNTAIVGSSMGGLMALFTILKHNDVFSKAGCLSSFLDPVMKEIQAEFKGLRLQDTRVFISWGSDEYRSKATLAKACDRNLQIAHSFTTLGACVYPYLHVRGKHNEASWEKELPLLFPFLFQN